MRKLIVDEWLTLDGVAQALGQPDEDPSGGFDHGGWHMRYADGIFQDWVLDNLRKASGIVLGGRRMRGSRALAAHFRGGAGERGTVE